MGKHLRKLFCKILACAGFPHCNEIYENCNIWNCVLFPHTLQVRHDDVTLVNPQSQAPRFKSKGSDSCDLEKVHRNDRFIVPFWGCISKIHINEN